MATFIETRAPTSRKYVSEQGIMMPNLCQTIYSIFLVTLLCFCFRKVPQKSKFSEFFLPLKQTLMVYFNEKRVPTFRKNVAEPDIIMTNFFQSLQFIWSHFSVFALEK